jgi:hypothetical protein
MNKKQERDAELMKRWCEATGTTEQFWIEKLKSQIAPPLFHLKVGLRKMKAAQVA